MTASTNSVFLLMINGTIESAEIPEFNEIFIKYFFVSGQDWEFLSGIDEGSTQIGHKSIDQSQKIAFCFPIEATYRSTCPFGWPQIVLSCYGQDVFGNDVIRGYGVTHLPMSPGKHKVRVPLFVPQSTSKLQQFISWMRGSRAEYVDPRVIAHGEGRDVTRVKSQGHINLVFNIVTKDMRKLGYITNTNESQLSQQASHTQDMNHVTLANLTQNLGMQSIPENATPTPRLYN